MNAASSFGSGDFLHALFHHAIQTNIAERTTLPFAFPSLTHASGEGSANANALVVHCFHSLILKVTIAGGAAPVIEQGISNVLQDSVSMPRQLIRPQ